jgi:HPt (histidine-containing phosphotransfer) domain-containing protein
MTAHALVEERQRCLDAGMNDHVTKPIDPDALFATLLRWTMPRPGDVGRTDNRKRPVVCDEDVLPEMNGIDTINGLKRVAGNKRLYRDLLVQFAIKQGDADQRIRQALATSDPKLAEQIAHTVKGLAGNLGILTLHETAATLERAIREGQSEFGAFLDEFSSALSANVRQITATIAALSTIAAPVNNEFRPQAAAEALETLQVLLKSSDADSQEAYHAVVREVAMQVGQEAMAVLGAAINEFDFERALAKLDEIASACGLKGDLHHAAIER